MAVDERLIRVVLLCCDGRYQDNLAARLAGRYRLVGVVKVVNPQTRGSLSARLGRYANPLKLWRYLLARFHQKAARRSAADLVEALFPPAEAPSSTVPVTIVPNVNDQQAVSFVRQLSPDAICVNGTNLLRQPMLDLAPDIPLGIINLHTGLSPYSRGGNCNLFALLDGHPEWVGVTVHYIDPGIDSGDLIRTAQVPMEANDLYDHIDARTFRLGIDLLVQSVSDIANQRAVRVPQWEAGKLYLRRTGYVYEPWHWYEVNRRLKSGLVRRYLADRERIDRDVRLIGTSA